MKMEDSANVIISSESGSASMSVAGNPTALAGATGTATIDDSTISITAKGAESARISVGRADSLPDVQVEATLNLVNGTTVTVDNAGTFNTFGNFGRTAGIAEVTISGGSNLIIKATGDGNAIVSVGRDGGTATLTVTGDQSGMSVDNSLNIGRGAGGIGTLNIADGAVVTNGGTTRVGRADDSSKTELATGVVTIDGVGSRLNAGTTLMIPALTNSAPGSGTVNVVNNGTVAATTVQLNTDGTLCGNGTVEGDVEMDGGTLCVDETLGDTETLMVDGALDVTSGDLVFDVAGTGLGDADFIVVTSQADLAGSRVVINLADGYLPALGDRVEIMSASGFVSLPSPSNAVVQGAPPGFQFDFQIDGDKLVFVALSEARPTITAAIDIKPGSFPNCFNNNGHGCQRRSKSTPLAGVKMHHLMRFSPALAVVPVVHRRDPRCFV